MGRSFALTLFLLLFAGCVSAPAYAQVATLYGIVDDASAALVVEQIQDANERDSSNKPVVLFIDSDGGELTAGLKIIDAMAASRKPVWTVNVQMAASMAAIIFTYGAKRAMFPHAMLMLHHERGKATGSTEQILSEVGAWARVVQPIEARIAKQAGISREELSAKMAAGWWLLAHDAIRQHLADEILVMENYPPPAHMPTAGPDARR